MSEPYKNKVRGIAIGLVKRQRYGNDLGQINNIEAALLEAHQKGRDELAKEQAEALAAVGPIAPHPDLVAECLAPVRAKVEALLVPVAVMSDCCSRAKGLLLSEVLDVIDGKPTPAAERIKAMERRMTERLAEERAKGREEGLAEAHEAMQVAQRCDRGEHRKGGEFSGNACADCGVDFGDLTDEVDASLSRDEYRESLPAVGASPERQSLGEGPIVRRSAAEKADEIDRRKVLVEPQEGQTMREHKAQSTPQELFDRLSKAVIGAINLEGHIDVHRDDIDGAARELREAWDGFLHQPGGLHVVSVREAAEDLNKFKRTCANCGTVDCAAEECDDA